MGGTWVNSLSYVDDMVLLAPMVTALQTLLEVCRSYAAPHNIVFNTTIIHTIIHFIETRLQYNWHNNKNGDRLFNRLASN